MCFHDSENIWRGVSASSSHIWSIRTHLDHVRSIWIIDRPYGWSIIRMDDLSCGRWRGRYDRWNVFERKHFWEKMVMKNWVFYWIYLFFKSFREYDSENSAVFAVNSMRNCLKLIVFLQIDRTCPKRGPVEPMGRCPIQTTQCHIFFLKAFL